MNSSVIKYVKNEDIMLDIIKHLGFYILYFTFFCAQKLIIILFRVWVILNANYIATQ